MKERIICKTSFLLLPLIAISIVFSSAPLQAASTITARYSQAQGSQLVIEIMTGPNPPASAILVQHFPPGTRMLDAVPSASNYNEKKNTAKWLLRNLRPGRSTVTITLNRAVQRSEISADLRFKPQNGGGMTTIQVGK